MNDYLIAVDISFTPHASEMQSVRINVKTQHKIAAGFLFEKSRVSIIIYDINIAQTREERMEKGEN